MEKDEKKNQETQDIAWEELTEEEDFSEQESREHTEEDFEDDFEEEDQGFALKPWMIPAFAGMLILAILICIPLWKLTHRQQDTTLAGTGTEVTVESMENAPTGEVAATEKETKENGTEEGKTAEESSESAGAGQENAGVGANAGTGQENAGVGANAGTDQENAGTEQNTTVGQADGAQGNQAEQSVGGAETVQDPISGNASMSFQEVSESVTAKDVTNLRSVPSTEDSENVVGQLKNGEILERTGVNTSTGWSRLVYNGEIVYAVTQYVTTDVNYKTPVTPSNPNRVSTLDGRVIIFSDCDDYVTPKEYVNLRTEPSTSEGDSTIRCQVNNGENVHRTGYSPDSGWSRVEYNGEVLYVVSSLVKGVTVE